MIKKYKNLLFDLDGTLADPSEGITKCIAYALAHFGIEITDIRRLGSWIGPPIKQSLMEIYSFDEQQADLGVEKYRERFTDIGIYENKLYAGVPELLSQVKSNGYRVFLATSKPDVYAKRIVKHFGIEAYFEFVGGAALDDSRPSKAHVIRHVIEHTGIVPEESLMIGDRKYDVIGGKACGMDALGVLYGFGTKEELEQAGADNVVADIAELQHFFITK